MGYYALISKTNSVPISSLSQEMIFHQFLLRCDDLDNPAKGNERGRNSYPSIQSIARATGITSRSVRKNVSMMVETGLIREYSTQRYREYIKVKKGSVPLCREVNLSMLARLIDARDTIDTWRIAPEDPRYKALVNAAMTFLEDDWETRDWHIGYNARKLEWDGQLDTISPLLWSEYPGLDHDDSPDDDDDFKDNDHDDDVLGPLMEEDLDPYLQYRIEL